MQNSQELKLQTVERTFDAWDTQAPAKTKVGWLHHCFEVLADCGGQDSPRLQKLCARSLEILKSEASPTTMLQACGQGILAFAQCFHRAGTVVEIEESAELKRSPLHLAVRGKHTPMIRWLLDAGSYMDHRDSLGRTPLLYATAQRLSKIVGLLVRKGADVNAESIMGQTILSSVCKSSEKHSDRLQDARLALCLALSGARPHVKGKKQKQAPNELLTREEMDAAWKTFEDAELTPHKVFNQRDTRNSILALLPLEDLLVLRASCRILANAVHAEVLKPAIDAFYRPQDAN